MTSDAFREQVLRLSEFLKTEAVRDDFMTLYLLEERCFVFATDKIGMSIIDGAYEAGDIELFAKILALMCPAKSKIN